MEVEEKEGVGMKTDQEKNVGNAEASEEEENNELAERERESVEQIGGEKWGVWIENNEGSQSKQEGKRSGEGGKKTMRVDLKTEVFGLFSEDENSNIFPICSKSRRESQKKKNHISRIGNQVYQNIRYQKDGVE